MQKLVVGSLCVMRYALLFCIAIIAAMCCNHCVHASCKLVGKLCVECYALWVMRLALLLCIAIIAAMCCGPCVYAMQKLVV